MNVLQSLAPDNGETLYSLEIEINPGSKATYGVNYLSGDNMQATLQKYDPVTASLESG